MSWKIFAGLFIFGLIMIMWSFYPIQNVAPSNASPSPSVVDSSGCYFAESTTVVNECLKSSERTLGETAKCERIPKDPQSQPSRNACFDRVGREFREAYACMRIMDEDKKAGCYGAIA